MQVDREIPFDERGTLTTPQQFQEQQEAEDMETIRVRGPQRAGDAERLAAYDAARPRGGRP